MKTYLVPEDITRMEMCAGSKRDRLLVRILFHLGCRVSEAIAITAEHIDFERKKVVIRHLKTRLNLACPRCGKRLGKSHVFCPHCSKKVDKAITQSSKYHRQRELPVDTDTLAILKEYINNRPELNSSRKPILDISRHRAWQIVSKCAERAALPKLINPETGKIHNVSPHRLRDAFAVNAMKHDDSGDGLRLLQEHMGHASFNTTAKYRKISGDEHRQWYERLWG